MPKPQDIDYTTRIVSRHCPVTERKLTPCPQCGKLGRSERRTSRTGRRTVTEQTVVHRAKLVFTPLPALEILDACRWKED